MANRYDQVPYPSTSFPDAHPDRLHTMGRLFGMDPAPVEDCRVLEVGCASGGHLLAMAEQLPGAELVGIDASEVEIAEGRAAVAACDLSNVDLRLGDLAQVDPRELGTFDYFIAHGVYSWVPAAVQDALLRLAEAVLAPHGVAYISYNTLPGWHMRGMLRDMMLYHTRGHVEPAAQVQQARALLAFLAESTSERTPFGMLAQRELETLSTLSDAYLFHDLLEPENHAVYFHTFHERVEAAGLDYVGDAEISTMMASRFGERVQGVLSELSGDIVRFEQYADFLTNRMFRRSLLCRRGVELDRRIGWEQLRGMYLSSTVRPHDPGLEPGSDEPALFVTRVGKRLTTRTPLLKAALLTLARERPRAVAFEALVDEARSSGAVDAEEVLGRNLLTAYTQEVVRLHPRALALSPRPTERPHASRVARFYLGRGRGTVNGRHEWHVVSEHDRCLLLLCDGTRDRAGLLEGLVELAHGGTLRVARDGVPLADPAELQAAFDGALDDQLAQLARAGMLTT